MNLDPEERMNKILKYGGAGLAALLILGVFAWRLDVAHRRAEVAENQLAALKTEIGKAKPAPARAPMASLVKVDPDVATKQMLIGRWVNNGIHNGRDCTRTLEFDQYGTGHFRLIYSGGGVYSSESGPWNVRGDVCYIDVKAKDLDTYYLRIVRLTSEKLSVRNDIGIERVYERVK
jgi:hypothetical protein